MPNRIILFFAVVFLQSCQFSEKDNEQIRKCFADYKKAIITHQGKLGIECVDSKSIDYYAVTLRKVIEFDSLQIENQPPIDKYTILQIRQSVPYDSILQMDGKNLLIYLIDHAKAGNGNISEYEIGNIQIDHDTATVEKIIKGKATQFVYKFYKENNGWKLSTFSPREHKLYNLGIKYSIIRSKLPEDQFILNYIDTTSKTKLKDNIWHPLPVR
jgi:hypothetical protein